MLQYKVAVWYSNAEWFDDFYPELKKTLSRFQVARSFIRSDFAANALTLPSICSALNISITSIYPPHNGQCDPEHLKFDRTFHPVFHGPNKHVAKQVYLLWEGNYELRPGKSPLWTPARFVCCTLLSCEPKPNFYRHSILAKKYDARKLAKQGMPLEGADLKILDEVKGLERSEVGTITECYKHMMFCKNVFKQMPEIKCSDSYFNFVVKLDSYNQLKDDRFRWNMEERREVFLERDSFVFSEVKVAGSTRPQSDDDIILCVTYNFVHESTPDLQKKITVIDDRFGTLALYEYFNKLAALLTPMGILSEFLII